MVNRTRLGRNTINVHDGFTRFSIAFMWTLRVAARRPTHTLFCLIHGKDSLPTNQCNDARVVCIVCVCVSFCGLINWLRGSPKSYNNCRLLRVSWFSTLFDRRIFDPLARGVMMTHARTRNNDVRIPCPIIVRAATSFLLPPSPLYTGH